MKPVIESCGWFSDLEDEKTDKEEEKEESESEVTEEEEKVYDIDLEPIETPYVENTHEELGQVSICPSSFLLNTMSNKKDKQILFLP